jgi:hypothetical protein
MIRALLAAAIITAAAVAAAPKASADPINQLWGMLPAGYSPDSCQPVEAESGAIFQCGAVPGGPTLARYLLARDIASLDANFNTILADPSRTFVPCVEGHPPR